MIIRVYVLCFEYIRDMLPLPVDTCCALFCSFAAFETLSISSFRILGIVFSLIVFGL